jgi:hypothetical protein
MAKMELSLPKDRMIDKLTECFPGFISLMAAQRLATTEQSEVISWTRSKGELTSINHSPPLPLNGAFLVHGSSPGRFQPSRISCCREDSVNGAGSLVVYEN